jgi:GT2 family glycosyltransferase
VSAVAGRPRLAFLIPTRDRHACLARSLGPLLRAVHGLGDGGAEVLVCDQSREPFAAPAGVRVLHRPDLNGLPAARNVLLAASTAEVACFLDDDTDLAEDFAVRLRGLAEREPATVAWGPVVETRGTWTRRLHRLAQLGALRDPRRLVARAADRPARALFGCCFAVRRAWAAEVGFDSRRPGYALGEDLDFFLRLGRVAGAGRTIRFAAGLVAHHRRDGADRASPVARGRAKADFLIWLARRHGGRNPATMVHLLLALMAAGSGRGHEPGSWRGAARGVLGWW